ncbi:hypothetical protein [Actinokineospora sp.]
MTLRPADLPAGLSRLADLGFGLIVGEAVGVPRRRPRPRSGPARR